ncbi:MAG: IS30 family transposase [Clostridiaceae bacterium]|nr:IS30 family transposase [Clostridiaceae bacterium]
MKNLSYADRLLIEQMLFKGISKTEIAKKLGYSRSAIYYEIQRGLKEILIGKTYTFVTRYSAEEAQRVHDWRASGKGRPLKVGNNHEWILQVEEIVLKKKYSPYAALEVIKQQGGFVVSVPTLYRYIDAGYFPRLANINLPEKMKRKRSKHKTVQRNKYLHGLSIEHRPEHIKERDIVGHWEMDTVKGLTKDDKNLLVMTERYSRLQVIKLLPDRTALSVVRAVDRVFKQYGKYIDTITCDNGSEFAYVERIEHDVNGRKRCDLYFCHPYCASERGSNERANGIIRRWFPKGKSFSHIKQSDCDRVAQWMNELPRKQFHGMTAQEIFLKNCPKTIDN